MAFQYLETAVTTPAHCCEGAHLARRNFSSFRTTCRFMSLSLVQSSCGFSNQNPTRKFIHRQSKVAPWHSSLAPILTHNQEAEKPHYVIEKDWDEMPVAVIRVARQTVVLPHTQTSFPVNASSSCLFEVKPTLLSPNFTVVYVKPRIIQPTETHVRGYRSLVCQAKLGDYGKIWR